MPIIALAHQLIVLFVESEDNWPGTVTGGGLGPEKELTYKARLPVFTSVLSGVPSTRGQAITVAPEPAVTEEPSASMTSGVSVCGVSLDVPLNVK